jgi:hypothetical protein
MARDRERETTIMRQKSKEGRGRKEKLVRV